MDMKKSSPAWAYHLLKASDIRELTLADEDRKRGETLSVMELTIKAMRRSLAEREREGYR
jgi:hypothetical protein